MSNHAALQAPECLESKLQRVRYFPRQLLGAVDMVTDQDYVREKDRRHNCFLHGWGTVCGLEVTAAPTAELPWRVQIAAGYALGPYGDEIYVAELGFLDLARCGPGAATDPCEPSLLRTPSSASGAELFVAIKYAECLARPVRTMPAGCACEEEACEYSRISDSFQLECLTELPPSHQPPPGPSLCDIIAGNQLPACPPCPAEPWVVLAQVTLPASPTTNLTNDTIDNFVRRQVFSTAVLQEQLIACCCQSADLAISKRIAANEVTASERRRITYAITVSNQGPGSARNIRVVDNLSVTGGLIVDVEEFTASLGSWSSTEIGGETDQAQFTAEIPELGPQQNATLGFVVEIRDQEATVVNTVDVVSDTPDPDLSNNSATVTFPTPDVDGGGGIIVNPS